jgi:hypothetical protein
MVHKESYKMKKQIAAALFATGVVSFSVVVLADSKGIEGTVTKVEGEFYFVKDNANKEVKGHFNAKTKKTGDIKAGARVEIFIDDKGHTTEINVK